MKKYLLLSCVFSIVMMQLSAQKAVQKRKGLCSFQSAEFMDKKYGKLDTVPGRGIANNYYLWDIGQTVKVKFLPGGSKKLRNDVMTYAKMWEPYANIKFLFVADNAPDAPIRVKLTDNDGAWSVLGTVANTVAETQQTLNLDTVSFLTQAGEAYWKATIMHEFGHALGLMHEQGYPGAIKWNKQSMYDYYKRTNDWDSAMVNAQVFEVHDQFYTNGSSYDPLSIMHYSVQGWQTIDGKAIKENYVLSAGDKAIIGLLYPKTGTRIREVPRVSITNAKANFVVTSDAVRDKVLIYPSFDLKTSNSVGEVWVIIMFYDEQGQAIPDTDDKYNFSDHVATYAKLNLQPNAKMSYNKTALTKNLELSIPIEQIPGYEGKKVLVQTMTYLYDPVNDKSVGLYFSDPKEYQMPMRKKK